MYTAAFQRPGFPSRAFPFLGVLVLNTPAKDDGRQGVVWYGLKLKDGGGTDDLGRNGHDGFRH
jgi:hypothetical protein